jgi:hypothetical protein
VIRKKLFRTPETRAGKVRIISGVVWTRPLVTPSELHFLSCYLEKMGLTRESSDVADPQSRMKMSTHNLLQSVLDYWRAPARSKNFYRDMSIKQIEAVYTQVKPKK